MRKMAINLRKNDKIRDAQILAHFTVESPWETTLKIKVTRNRGTLTNETILKD